VAMDPGVQRSVARDHADYCRKKETPAGSGIVFEARGLTSRGLFEDVSFQARRGEILGFSGLVGAGRTEIMKAIFGALPLHQGRIFINGVETRITSPAGALHKGIAYMPEDRKREGLMLGLSMADNIVMSSVERIAPGGRINRARKSELVRQYMSELQIRPNDPNRRMLNFSGGNQQKGVIAKWLATDPKVVIMDEPTRGIDIGAKIEIYHLINALAAKGVGVIVVSSELTELIGICDRILVVSSGRLTGEFLRSEFTQDAIMFAATHHANGNGRHANGNGNHAASGPVPGSAGLPVIERPSMKAGGKP